MQHIIDTHTFLWFEDGSERLPAYVRDLIKDPANTTFKSALLRFGRLVLKRVPGKLPLTTSLLGLQAIAESQSIEILPTHCPGDFSVVQQLPLSPHRDPFDRIIAATTLTTGSILLSVGHDL